MRKQLGRLCCLFIVLLLIHAFVGCSDQSSQFPDHPLCFPGTQWDMTPSEVKSALSLDDARCISGTDNGTLYVFSVSNWTVLGQEAVVTFRFQDYARAGQPGLRFVYVYFPGETDYATLQAAAAAAFGAPSRSDNTSCTWNSSETIGPYMDEAYARVKHLNPEVYAAKYELMKEDPASWATLYETAAAFYNVNQHEDYLEEYQDCPHLVFWGNVAELLQYIQYGCPIPG